jgi:hypothetical protein
MDIKILVNSKGENLLFFVSNTISRESALYRMGINIERNPIQLTAMGNFNQMYIWKKLVSTAMFVKNRLV